MLWELKRTVSMRQFFWAPKLMGKENIYNFMLKNIVYLNLCICTKNWSQKSEIPVSGNFFHFELRR